uniref:RRM domain-containing protein n=1 Tax=Pyrodinium bahamense TaxID=73915 RepID=A0A7S0FPB4_9DINO|mmetsp:Transcript_40381/g.112139  ORF Transcript_40381/g.112139 Transcript_40381/m.112139 type:complete len:157 (+) Transcript_40381:57-527(+)
MHARRYMMNELPTPAVHEERGKRKGPRRRRDFSKDICACEAPITTVMIRNVPCRITQARVAEVLDGLGYARKCDLLFLPNRPNAEAASHLGYGFVNFKRASDAESFTRAIEGYRFKGTTSTKVCAAQPAHVQGFDNTLKLLRGLKRNSTGSFLCSL